MPNDAREMVAAGVYAHCQGSYAAAWDNDSDECKSADLEIADAAIAAHSAHLWERADSYDFFDALEEWVQTNDNHDPEMIAKFTLEYLIGPKDEGQEATNDN